jgi:hypothetical protein
MTPWSLCVVSLINKSSAAENGAICSPLRKTIFYAVECEIDEYSCIIPHVRFDTSSLVNQGMLGEVPVRDRDSCVIPQNRSANVHATTPKYNTRTNGNSTLTMFTHQRNHRYSRRHI